MYRGRDRHIRHILLNKEQFIPEIYNGFLGEWGPKVGKEKFLVRLEEKYAYQWWIYTVKFWTPPSVQFT